MNQPKKSYTIWFSQRTGSTLLNEALSSTGVAGDPCEWLTFRDPHIWMTRRNKVRLAVSWWRAIVSGEWHRKYGEKPQEHDIADKYSFDAINHLFIECSIREAAMEQFFSEEEIVPLTIVYEDFILDYEGTIMKVLEFLPIPTDNVKVSPPSLARIADDVAEQWVQRFREERQKGWENRRW